MFKTLGPEAIGIRGLMLPDAIALTRDAGFTGLAFDIRAAADLVDERGTAEVADLFARNGVRPGHWGLPVAWRGDDATWSADLEQLPRLAAVATGLGCPRTATFLPSGSDELPYQENFDFHVDRLRPVAAALGEAGCRLGLEYVGPKTFQARFRYPFIRTLPELLELVAAIGTGNVGLMLDAWHLYTSGGSNADLDRLTAADVVVVHVNDAPAGIAVDEQIDTVRELPLATGVIDLVGFMGRLRDLGYDGPVMPEPFSARLNELAATDPAAAAREAGRSMAALWRAAGLS